MRIEILTQAKGDLFDGYLFYERQQAGIGDYFLDSLSSDIDSLLIHTGRMKPASAPTDITADKLRDPRGCMAAN